MRNQARIRTPVLPPSKNHPLVRRKVTEVRHVKIGITFNSVMVLRVTPLVSVLTHIADK